MPQPLVDGRRVRGDESRRSILNHAVALATMEGLDPLSIGRLAEASGHSKSGIATLFGAKEQLQLATVTAAREIFIAQVVDAARAESTPGLARVAALISRWIAYSEARVFPGGCFFAAASVEFDTKPGPIRDAVTAATREWEEYLARHIGIAVASGELASDTDADQIAFEIAAFLDAANTRSLSSESLDPYRRAAAAVRARLAGLGAEPAALEHIA